MANHFVYKLIPPRPTFAVDMQKNVFARRRWRTRNELTYEVVVWIEHTYNRRRRQRALGKLTPVGFELAFSAPPCLEAA